MPASGVPGLAYAVVHDAEITAAGARGVAKAGEDRKVTSDTPFLTGSISKSFTALAVMQLVEAGKVDLDADIAQYLDAFSGRPAGAITVRQLLSHTSGFSTTQGNEPFGGVTGGKDELAGGSNARRTAISARASDGEVHESMATGHTSWFTTKRALAGGAADRPTAQGGRPGQRGVALLRLRLVRGAGRRRVAHRASPGFESLAWMLPAQRKGAVVLVNAVGGLGFAETTELRSGSRC